MALNPAQINERIYDYLDFVTSGSTNILNILPEYTYVKGCNGKSLCEVRKGLSVSKFRELVMNPVAEKNPYIMTTDEVDDEGIGGSPHHVINIPV